VTILIYQQENLVQPILTIDLDTTISKVVSLFQKSGKETISIAVINDQQKFQGLLRPRDILGKGIKSSAIIRNYINPNVLSIRDSDDILNSPENLGGLILKSNFRIIPVLDQYDRIVGGISDLSLLENLILNERPDFEIPVREAVPSWDFFSLTLTDSVGTMIAELRKRGYSQIPVCDKEKNEIVGIVKIKDVLKAHKETSMSPSVMRGIGEKAKDWYLLPVKNFITNPLICSGNDLILKAIKLMIKHRSHSLIVEDGEKKGIITAQDMISIFVTKQRTRLFKVIVTDSPDEELKEHAINKGINLMETFSSWLGANATLRIRLKRNPSIIGSQFSTTVQAHLASIKGHVFTTESTDYVIEKAVNAALDQLFRVISKEKEKTIDRRIDQEPHRYPKR
jgi:CBS domain-containing protein/ribosome-associated translation inhibitor RaiA